ncbi:MAG: ABC-F family ATP-binding cassette domain-containing protein [Bacteroidales bacterium]|nr:ABC-F family ATP-binding cassette domain-containing protein [Bacteroidales bacterium]
MNYLSVENLTKYYGDRVLFENLNFGLAKGDRVALIAANGAGKSTLLKILAGKDIADDGNVAVKDGVRLVMLEQEPELDENLSVNQLIKETNSELVRVIRIYEEALKNQSDNFSSETQKAFEEASARMDEVNGWDYERRMKEILERFLITDLDQQINTLSGGQKKRVALALVLLDEPDLLILDEPTNHLDIEMIEWLEKFILSSNITLLTVTHDRYFLDRVCTRIIELSDGNLYLYKGNYAYFLEKKAAREEIFKTETQKAGKLLKKELEWMRRMPKARTHKSKSRIDAVFQTEEKAKGKNANPDIKFDVKMSRMGKKVMELKKIYKSYGKIKILDDYSYTFHRGDRIGFIGHNGTGKTSFLNVITGLELPDSGEVISGETIVYAYYKQEGIVFDEEKRVIDIIKDIAEVVAMGNGSLVSASQFLQFFMFNPVMQYTPVSKLSGGEKRRLYLLTVLIRNPNFLILDEPTNDLDIMTLNKLEEFLSAFKGVLILVSHDRYFLDKLADHYFIFRGNGKIDDFYGTFSEYRLKAKENITKKRALIQQTKKSENHKKKENEPVIKQKLSFKEKREYNQLEKEIEELEKRKNELEESLNSGTLDYADLEKASKDLKEILELIDEKTLRWMELDEYVSNSDQ